MPFPYRGNRPLHLDNRHHFLHGRVLPSRPDTLSDIVCVREYMLVLRSHSFCRCQGLGVTQVGRFTKDAISRLSSGVVSYQALIPKTRWSQEQLDWGLWCLFPRIVEATLLFSASPNKERRTPRTWQRVCRLQVSHVPNSQGLSPTKGDCCKPCTHLSQVLSSAAVWTWNQHSFEASLNLLSFLILFNVTQKNIRILKRWVGLRQTMYFQLGISPRQNQLSDSSDGFFKA